MDGGILECKHILKHWCSGKVCRDAGEPLVQAVVRVAHFSKLHLRRVEGLRGDEGAHEGHEELVLPLASRIVNFDDQLGRQLSSLAS